jgi:hypothetical protein
MGDTDQARSAKFALLDWQVEIIGEAIICNIDSKVILDGLDSDS